MVKIITTTFRFLLIILVFLGSFISSFSIADFFKIKDIKFMMTITFLLIILILYVLRQFKFKEIFGEWKIKKEIFFWSFIYITANIFLNYIFEELFHPSILPSKMLHSKTLGNMIFLAFLAPILEEIIFRGIICNILKNKFTLFITILISGFIFASIHGIPGITFVITGSTFYFGYIYLKTKSLWNSIIIHIINNSTFALILFLGKDEAIENINLGMFGYAAGFISLLLCFYNFYRMYKNIHFEKSIKKEEIEECI